MNVDEARNLEDVRRIYEGDVVAHFKYENIDPSSTKYLYQYMGLATHTETEEALAVYREIDGEKRIWARPAELFFSRVDKDKYPDVKAEYRLTKFDTSTWKVLL